LRGLVTIFGGSGFVGSHVVRALAKEGRRIRVAVRRPWRAYKLRLLGDVGQIEIVQASVRVPDTVGRALEGAEAAVYAVGALYESGAQDFASLHAEGPRVVAEASASLGLRRLVLVSAIGADPHAASKYARTKGQGEAAARETVPSLTILRPSVVFGPEDQFFNRFAAMATVSPVLPLIGGGHTRMQPVFVADVARAAATALADAATEGRTYELGGPGVHSFRELMQLMLLVIGRDRTLLPIPWDLARLLALGGDLAAMLRAPLPMIPPPPLTSDQVTLLQTDNVVSAGAQTFADLGVAATAMEPILPTYLYSYRKGGQYADLPRPTVLQA
jgi:uncharacterized protein YbjT (DUF2867 family)